MYSLFFEGGLSPVISSESACLFRPIFNVLRVKLGFLDLQRLSSCGRGILDHGGYNSIFQMILLAVRSVIACLFCSVATAMKAFNATQFTNGGFT